MSCEVKSFGHLCCYIYLSGIVARTAAPVEATAKHQKRRSALRCPNRVVGLRGSGREPSFRSQDRLV